MKKTIRLTESDLIKIVKRVIKEQETDESVFGDIVKNEWEKFIGKPKPKMTEDEKKLANDIMNKIKSGDYYIFSNTYGKRMGGYIDMRINLNGERYFLYVKNADEGYDLETVVKPHGGRVIAHLPHDFTNQLIKELESQGKRKR